MSAKIKTPLGEAIIRNGTWSSENKELEKLLKAYEESALFAGYEPNPDYASAKKFADDTPGVEVVSWDETEYEEGTIY